MEAIASEGSTRNKDRSRTKGRKGRGNISVSESTSSYDRSNSREKTRSRSSSRESGQCSDDELTQERVLSEERKLPCKDKKDKKRRKRSLEETFEKMQRIIGKKGFVDAGAMKKLTKKLDFDVDCNNPPAKKHASGGDRALNENGHMHKQTRKGRGKFFDSVHEPDVLPSDITIYDQAVKLKSSLKRPSTSSEKEIMEWMDSSDEMEFLEQNSHHAMADNFISDMKKHYEEHRGGNREDDRNRSDQHREESMDKLDQMIRDAEVNKAKILGTPGMVDYADPQKWPNHYTGQFPQQQMPLICMPPPHIDINRNFVHSAMVDETYMLVASHLDESIIRKIENSEYVDFIKLIPKDKIVAEDDTELKLVMHEGKTFYVPVKEIQAISGFSCWEQAFRVFSNIYTQMHPTRATELIQYNHVIHTASLTYIWSNVYAYDQDFRVHISKHPGRSWAILLQQSWSMRLQERLRFNDFNHHLNGHKKGNNSNNKTSPTGSSSSDACRKYNKGKCPFGSSCKYDHKCSYCFKFGHTILTCHKLVADRERNGNQHTHHAGQNGGDRREVVIDTPK